MATKNEEFMAQYGVHPTEINLSLRSLNSAKVGLACRAARSLKQSTDCFLVSPTRCGGVRVLGVMGRQGMNPKAVEASGAREDIAQFLGVRLGLRNAFILQIMAHMPGPFLLNRKYVAAIAGDTVPCDRSGADITPTSGFEVDGFGNAYVDVSAVIQGHLDDVVVALLKPLQGLSAESPLWNWQKAWIRPLDMDIYDEPVDFGGGPVIFEESAE